MLDYIFYPLLVLCIVYGAVIGYDLPNTLDSIFGFPSCDEIDRKIEDLKKEINEEKSKCIT